MPRRTCISGVINNLAVSDGKSATRNFSVYIYVGCFIYCVPESRDIQRPYSAPHFQIGSRIYIDYRIIDITWENTGANITLVRISPYIIAECFVTEQSGQIKLFLTVCMATQYIFPYQRHLHTAVYKAVGSDGNIGIIIQFFLGFIVFFHRIIVFQIKMENFSDRCRGKFYRMSRSFQVFFQGQSTHKIVGQTFFILTGIRFQTINVFTHFTEYLFGNRSGRNTANRTNRYFFHIINHIGVNVADFAYI